MEGSPHVMDPLKKGGITGLTAEPMADQAGLRFRDCEYFKLKIDQLPEISSIKEL